jgi:hypothetical protein
MKLRFSYFILLASAMFASGSYGYSYWSEARRHKAALPVVALGGIVEDLADYHGRMGQFPQTLRELHRSLERPAAGLEFGRDGRTIRYASYYYIYRRLEHDEAVIWAIPVGERAGETATHFVAVGKGQYRHWKGPALSREEASRVEADVAASSTIVSLKSLRLIEQTDRPAKITSAKAQIR